MIGVAATSSDRLGPPLSRAGFAALGLVASAVIIVLGNVKVAPGENGGLGPALITAAGCLILAVVLFAMVVPAVPVGGRRAVVLGVLSVVSLAVFWSGAVGVLASAAVASLPAETGRGPRIAAVAAVVAAGLAVAVSLIGFVS